MGHLVKRPGLRGGFTTVRRHYVYAVCTHAEHVLLERLAKKEGLSISNFVRRCVNGYLLELGDDVTLLEEYHPAVRPPKPASLSGRGRPRNADRWA
jgi:Mobilization protein NikA